MNNKINYHVEPVHEVICVVLIMQLQCACSIKTIVDEEIDITKTLAVSQLEF